uniref:GNAT family N-acetyltransferase n=1 Tax=Ferroglobus sp. TaxID=2614230 RepID=UPI0025BBA594
VKIHMEEPIRYGKGDPIEAWLYEVLMLDAQTAKIEEEDIEKIKRGELEFEEIDKDELIKNDLLLREFFGIYVLAHYRNRPSDLVILLDMPNHLPLRVKVNNKTVCSLHIAIEGKMDEATIEKIAKGYKPKGQIIPDLILKHYWNYEFPKLTGIRIVRIATHPDVMDMGIGSFALKKAVEWAKSKGMDWAGSGFGVSPELLRFWMRNGFIPVHITPQRNEVSGEHSTIVLKALNDKVYEMLEEINSEFIRRVIELLGDELKDLEVETTKLLLSSILKPARVPKPEFGRVERRRIKKYLQGQSLYEYTSDIIKPIVRYYYSQTEKIDLEEDEEKLLIAKCLQLKSWSEIHVEKSYKKMVKAVQKLWRWFYEGGEED